MNITAILLVKNEEKTIQRAVNSVSFCDEILVIDDESTDSTATKAKELGAAVFTHALNGNFSEQRNWAMQQAKNNLILFLDADEIISEELKTELISCEFQSSCYAIPRRDFFWDSELKHGETQKARMGGIVRLLKKGSGTWEGKVHEEYISTDAPGRLKGFIDHYSHDSLSSFIQDINIYSTIRAEELSKNGKKISIAELIFFPLGKFFYTYFMLAGFLDGPAGFVYSFVMSFHSFLVRAKLLTKLYV